MCLVFAWFYFEFVSPLLVNVLYSQGDNGLPTTVLLTSLISYLSAMFPRISLN